MKKYFSLIRSELINKRIIAWKFQKKIRAFIYYLELKNHGEVDNIKFQKSESPDFIVDYKGYEVDEGTNPYKAQFDKILYYGTGRDKNLINYCDYVKKQHKNQTGKYVFKDIDDRMVCSAHKGMTDMRNLRNDIGNAINGNCEHRKC